MPKIKCFSTATSILCLKDGLRVKQYRKRNESEDFERKAATLKRHGIWRIEGDDE